jgi:hypothetical protein
LLAGSGQNLCFPTCATTPQCAAFGSAATCVTGTSVESTPVMHCNGNLGNVGDKCTTGTGCASGVCVSTNSGQPLWCTQACATSADCGASTAGQPNACFRSNNGQNLCFPTCSTSAQCQAYAASAACLSGTTADGATAMACDGEGALARVGDKCAQNADCASGICETNSAGQSLWCSQSCTASSQCGTSSAGLANVCSIANGGVGVCFPTCSTTAQCQAFAASATCGLFSTVENTSVMQCDSP